MLPLFARLSLQEQHKVFHPGSKRRIVLATNVAETSLTVPGIKYVIDTGTARISRYSHRTKVQRLPIERVSQASANQRSGRCGRVSDGIAIRLYSEEDFESRPLFTDPEILRTNLAAVILQMTAMGVARGPKDVENFPFVEPPDSRAINDGVTLLRELGALSAARPQEETGDGDGRAGRPAPAGDGGRSAGGLTAVGQQLAQLPVDPRLGRMIVESGKRGCVREVMILAAALTIQDPRERPDRQAAARRGETRTLPGREFRLHRLPEPLELPPGEAAGALLHGSSAGSAAPSSSTTCASASGRTCSPSCASSPGRWASAWTTSAWPIRWATMRASTSACSPAC